MIETKCPTCGQKIIEPDPQESKKTPLERIQFEKDWDRRVKNARDVAEPVGSLVTKREALNSMELVLRSE
jgi:hypothetical protein